MKYNRLYLILSLIFVVLLLPGYALFFPILGIADSELYDDKTWWINESEGSLQDNGGYLGANITWIKENGYWNQSGNTLLPSNPLGYINLGVDSLGYASYFVGAGDIYTGGDITLDGQIMSWAPAYGINILANENAARINITGMGSTTTLDATTQYICDSTDPFSSFNKGMWLTVINSTPSFADATGEINEFINSTCIRVSFASAGSDSIVNATGMNYIVYPHPTMGILDNGFISFQVGENKDTQFEIHIPDGAGFTGVLIEDVAGVNSHEALTINQDGKNYDGIVGLNIYTYSSVAVDGKLGINTLLEIDGSNVTDSEGRFIDMRLIGQSVNSEVDGIVMDPNIDHIIHIGSSDTLSSAYVKDVNETYNFTTAGAGATMFNNVNDYVYIGNTANFTDIAFSLSTTSSKNLELEYYYCNTSNVYETLTGVTDTTDGMVISGTITFINPSNRGKCNIQFNGTAFSDTTNYSYIALKRTRSTNLIDPVENLVSIGGSTTYFILQKDMMKLQGSVGGPETCTASFAGAIYYDSTGVQLLWCDGASWQPFASAGDVTTHNSLSGLQGGQAAEYYHTTLAQHTIATQTATASRDGYLTSTDWTAFNKTYTNATPITLNTSTNTFGLKTCADNEVLKMNGAEWNCEAIAGAAFTKTTVGNADYLNLDMSTL